MPIQSPHPLYTANADRWQRCRDVYEGEDAVKARGEVYLPRPGGLDHKEFSAYIHRGMFYEAMGRTIDGFVGAISRKDPVVEVPAKLQPVLDDATGDGLSLIELVKQLCSEAILQGRGGLLVDFDDDEQRPFFSVYRVEDIINWSDAGIVLRETVYEADPADPFLQRAIEQYRQLAMVDAVYTVTVWRNANGAGWKPFETVTPKKRGKAFDAIPFLWLTPLGKTSRIEKPPLLGLANVCLAHYRNSADLEHGLHFTGLPTLYVTGRSPADGPISIGSTSAIVMELPEAKVGYAEFTGQGLDGLQNAMAAKQSMMAVLGASVFENGPKGVEAAETARIRTSGETSLLAGVTTAVEETLEAALTIAAEWMGVAGNVEITLNRDYVDSTMDGPTLTGLVQAYQAGALSLPQFLFNLQQSEMLKPDTDLEEEAAVVAAETAKKAADAVKLAQATKPKPTA